MKALLLLLALLNGPTITSAGYCPDVSSPTCEVREFWPRFLRAQSVGVEAYYFASGEGDERVAFVTRAVYAKYAVGMSAPEGLVWRQRQP